MSHTNDLAIAASPSTPEIQGEWEAGILTLIGDSYPENSFELFGPVLSWVERYLAQSKDPLQLQLQLVYLNTSSIKIMMDIFDLLEGAFQTGRNVSVQWLYDERNERVAELAGEFQEDCSFPFMIAPFAKG